MPDINPMAYDAWKLASPEDLYPPCETEDIDDGAWCFSCEADVYDAQRKGLLQCPECGWFFADTEKELEAARERLKAARVGQAGYFDGERKHVTGRPS